MQKFVYGIDVGGTNIKIGLFIKESMNMIDQLEIKTPESNHQVAIFQSIFNTVVSMNQRNNLSMDQIYGIGLAVPCPVKNGLVKHCPNLSWRDMDVIASMRGFFPSDIQVVVSNDANVAAYGENMVLENPYMNAVFYTLGTGVGGGIIIDGNLLEGGTGLGGEIGHMFMFDGATKDCGCGSRGCLEQICGTAGILSYANELSQTSPTILDMSQLTVKAVFDAAKLNDSVAYQVVLRLADYIARSASILAVVLDPEVFIIGGGISKAGDFLIQLVETQYKNYARFTTTKIPFILARTGNNAGIIGAAYMAKKQQA
ncbi:MAG: ROK family protein [Acholeplasmataceae bacterium]|jgi:glucokinase|nr:ROK family protein [Acholeplasmataceae bacterium]